MPDEWDAAEATSGDASAPSGAAGARRDASVEIGQLKDLCFTVFSEKIPDRGEDAEPLVVYQGGRTFLAVLDGLGGSGAARYVSVDDPEHPVKGAYLASRAAQGAVEEFLRLDAGGLTVSTPALAADIQAALAGLASSHRSASRVVARNKQSFPTTLALVGIDGSVNDWGKRALSVVWCGDSRVFGLHPEHGLVQLTRDHVRGDDDEGGLGGDSPMSRQMSADGVDLDVHAVAVPGDTVLIAATDGCFAYWPSIMHFERVLLTSLADARSVGGWADDVRTRIVEVAGDDATMALSAPGCTDLDELKAQFSSRLWYVDHLLAAYDPEDAVGNGFLWRRFAVEYRSFMAPPAVTDAPRPAAEPLAAPEPPAAPDPVAAAEPSAGPAPFEGDAEATRQFFMPPPAPAALFDIDATGAEPAGPPESADVDREWAGTVDDRLPSVPGHESPAPIPVDAALPHTVDGPPRRGGSSDAPV